MVPELTVKGVTKQVAETFKFELDRGWLNVTINEDLGSVAVHSDWGNATAMWSAQAGKLKQFIGCIDASYFDKNLRGREGSRYAIDWAGAEEKLKAQVIEARKGGGFTYHSAVDIFSYIKVDKNTAKMYWDDIESWCGDPDKTEAEALSYVPDSIHKLTEGEPWYLLENKLTPMSEFWLKHLVPTILAYFKEHYHAYTTTAPGP